MTTNDNRLGAIADIQYVIEHHQLDEDVMVLAGDNLFEFELTDFVRFYDQVQMDAMVHELADQEQLKRTGVVEVDAEDTVVSFEEKPDKPKSNLAVPPFYNYRRATLPLFATYLAEDNDPDAPGNHPVAHSSPRR